MDSSAMVIVKSTNGITTSTPYALTYNTPLMREIIAISKLRRFRAYNGRFFISNFFIARRHTSPLLFSSIPPSTSGAEMRLEPSWKDQESNVDEY
jgi:hypothetical protein